ncbi:MAG: oligosaccharide flippase family protein [Nanoarchaeota archaeon]
MRPIVRGSIILLVGFGLFNFLNFIYQSVMARFLSIADYGILAALGAIIYIFTIFSESIQTVIAKYTVSSPEDGQLKSLLIKSLKKSSYFATIAFIIYLLISIVLSSILKIPYLLLALNGILLYTMFMLPVTRGALQGRKKFTALSSNLVIESASKLILGIVFVLIGWKVYGAIGGFLIGAFVGVIVSFIPLKSVFQSKEKPPTAVNIYSYALPTMYVTAVIVIFSSIDVLVAQFLFDFQTAGAYSIASILGKIVLWISVPIGKAMFPLSVESGEQPLKNKKIFKTAFGLISLIIIGVILFFALFTSEIIYIFSGNIIPQAIEILPYLTIAFGLIALTNVILLYKLSLGKVKGYSWLIIFNIIEIALFFLPNTIMEFTLVFLISSIIFFIGSIFAMNNKSR